MSSEELRIHVPGKRDFVFRHLVLDFNGTMACDGELLAGLSPLLERLALQLDIHVLTADTYGTVRQKLSALPVGIHMINGDRQDFAKEQILLGLPTDRVAIGNGANDVRMLAAAELGIAVLEPEMLYRPALDAADLVCLHLNRALEVLLNPGRLVAGLREA